VRERRDAGKPRAIGIGGERVLRDQRFMYCDLVEA